MSDYEIPLNKDKGFQYRFFEILPGALSWSALALPFILAFVSVTTAAIIMIAYLMLWFVKAVVLNLRAVQGYRLLQEHQELDWQELIKDLDQEDIEKLEGEKKQKFHKNFNSENILSKDFNLGKLFSKVFLCKEESK